MFPAASKIFVERIPISVTVPLKSPTVMISPTLYSFSNTKKDGASDDAVSDVHFFDAFDGGNRGDVPVVEAMAGEGAQAVLAGENGHVGDGGNFAVHFLHAAEVAGGGVLAGVEFDEVRTDFLGGLHLFRFGLDKDAYGDVVALERHDELGEVVNLGGDVQAAFRSDFLAVLGNERDHVGLDVRRELKHFVRRSDFQVELGRYRTAQQANVTVLDVALVFAQVGGNAVATGQFGNERGSDRIGFPDLTCFTDSGDVVDVDSELNGHCILLVNTS